MRFSEMNKWLYEKPEKYGFKSGSWHIDMVESMLVSNYGVACSRRTLRRALRKIHFSYRKASRTVPHNSAGRKEREAFMEMTRERAADLRKK